MNADELFLRLKEYGADAVGIGDRFNGDANLYKQCLRDFLYDLNLKKLESARAETGCENAYEAAHALKGLSGNLGLTPFYNVISEMTDRLKAGDRSDYDKLYARVLEQLQNVKDLLPDDGNVKDANELTKSAKPEQQNDTDYSWNMPDDKFKARFNGLKSDEPFNQAEKEAVKNSAASERDKLPESSKSPPSAPPDDSLRKSARIPNVRGVIEDVKKHLKNRNVHAAAAILCLITVVVVVVWLFLGLINGYNDSNISASASHLKEISFQIKLYVEECMEYNWRAAHSVANSIAYGNLDSEEELFNYVRGERDTWGVTDIILYNDEGLAIDTHGETRANDEGSQTVYNASRLGEYLTIIDSNLIYSIAIDTKSTLRSSKVVAISVCHDLSTFLDEMGFSSFDSTAYMYLTQQSGVVISSLTHERTYDVYNIKSLFTNDSILSLDRDKATVEEMLATESATPYIVHQDDEFEYVISTPILARTSTLRLFYIVPEESVDATIAGFSRYVTLLSVILIVIVLTSCAFIFMQLYSSREKIFDKEILSREHMFDVLVENTETAFGLFRLGDDAPVYISKNIRDVTGQNPLAVEKTPLGYSMRVSGESNSISRVNEVMRSWDGKGSFSSGYIHNGADGKQTYYELQLFSVAGNADEYICIAQNVTSDYEREKALREALVMAETANKAKSRFLSNMSHDIRTPMNAIVNMTNFAIDSMNDTMRLREYLFTIKKSSDHLLNLINDVLTMSRIESDKAVLRNEPFNLMELLNRTADIVRPLCKAKNLTFISDFASVTVINVEGDHVKLSQILMNLLSNAVKYTPNNGAVRFTAINLQSIREDVVDVRFIVEDNGIGIPKDFIPSIFEPFNRVDNHRTSVIEGSGLGLSICRSYVAIMGGSIKCESEEGNGSTFTVELYFKKAKSVAASTDNKDLIRADKPFLGKHCLVCEDNVTNLTIAKTMLERLGFLIDTARDGLEGVRAFVKSPPGKFDIIYMDIQMPVMDGYEATVAIRESEHPQAKTVPIVAMTANVFSEDIEKARIAGMDGHIGKPMFTIELVKETIRVLNEAKEA